MQQPLTNQAVKGCIELCRDCHAICVSTSMYCLQLGGAHAEVSYQRLLHDCAQICQTSADFMLRGSPLHTAICGVCAQICTECAEACERVDPGDAQMKACADLCRRCVQFCERMAHAQV